MIKKVFFCVFILFFMSISTVFAAERPRWVAQPIYVYIPSLGKYSALMQRAFMAGKKSLMIWFVSNSLVNLVMLILLLSLLKLLKIVIVNLRLGVLV